MARPPGTVSKILWHFTGGPKWDPVRQKQETRPKSPGEAYANLAAIVRSHEVRLGGYKEIVTVVLPKAKKLVRIGSRLRYRTYKNVRRTIQSTPVCCLSDIPAAHLHYHAKRYGKFAIGFHRDAVLRAGFHPVCYALDKAEIIRTLYRALSSVNLVSMSQIESAVSDLQYAAEEADFKLPRSIDTIEFDLQDMEAAIDKAKQSLAGFLAYVKTFGPGELATIYCEREWRSTRTFQFRPADVAMIVLPKGGKTNEFHKVFAERLAPSLGIPRTVPIITWEDLIEH